MLSLLSYLKGYLTNEEGASMVEYALIAALISVAAITVLPMVGDQISMIFSQIAAKLSGS